MKASTLTGRAVVTLSDAEKVGHIVDVLFDATYRHVLGFRIKQGTFSHAAAVLRTSVTAVGPDALTVQGTEAINAEERFADLAGAASLDHVRKTKVVTEGGALVGTISDLDLDEAARHVRAYLLTASLLERLRAGTPQIAAEEVARLGADGLMIIPDAVSARVQEA